jgi:hypothetical protein
MSAQSAGLGGGGMGVVHRAEDLKLSRRFTLKFLPDELSGGLRALGRLKQEARAAIPHSAFRTWLVPRGLTALYRWRPAGTIRRPQAIRAYRRDAGATCLRRDAAATRWHFQGRWTCCRPGCVGIWWDFSRRGWELLAGEAGGKARSV